MDSGRVFGRIEANTAGTVLIGTLITGRLLQVAALWGFHPTFQSKERILE